jgi:nucleotide-binding universal stress UspA family protein
MYGRILIALDGSNFSEAILGYVQRIAPGLNVPVELLHVYDSHQPTQYALPTQADRYLENVAASLANIAEVKCTCEMGNPADRIVDLAAADPGTLIAMTTHGYSGPKRWLLGSVTEKVLHAARSDLLVMRPSQENANGSTEIKTFLVPLDGSQLAEKVLPTVVELAVRLSLEVVLVRVVKHFYTAPPEAFLPVFGANVPNLKQLRQDALDEANNYLLEKVAALRALGLTRVSPFLMESGVDGAAAEIVDLTKKTPNPLVVMCSHGESGVARWLIGSVTERVVRYSGKPVLVVRAPS